MHLPSPTPVRFVRGDPGQQIQDEGTVHGNRRPLIPVLLGRWRAGTYSDTVRSASETTERRGNTRLNWASARIFRDGTTTRFPLLSPS
jgi:hypothetical protein